MTALGALASRGVGGSILNIISHSDLLINCCFTIIFIINLKKIIKNGIIKGYEIYSYFP